MRGESIERISAQVDMDSATTRRRIIEGTAIIRTGDAHRVVSAVRNGQLSQKVVDSITQSGMATHDMIEALEAQAVSKLLGNFVTEDGHVASAAIDEGAILTDLRARAEKVALPQTVGSLKTLLPQIAEEYGLQRRTRSPQDTLVGPMILEWHLLKAMSDWEQIEADCEEEYAPTRDDMNAFLALCQMIAQRCPQHPDALMVDIEEAISG
jgi:hypothetical protein